jgi:IS1 family transposase
MRKLSVERRAAILSALVEGASVASVVRMTGASKVTVLRLLADAGTFCADYHNLHVRRLLSARVEADELWSFCGCKAATKAAGGIGHGDIWTWVATDADTKLCISYLVADRGGTSAKVSMHDLAERVSSRIQLSTDAHSAYPSAVEEAFGGAIDYAVIRKTYASDRVGEARYSPPRVTGCVKHPVQGDPEMHLASTSYAERSNLTVRMGSRRFTRLTNGFSKRAENHAHAVALHFWNYNFARKHMTLKTTPAVAAGIATKPLTMLDLAQMIEDEERRLGCRLTDYLPAAT